MKYFRFFLRGGTFGSEEQEKTYVWLSTKGAVQEVLRRKYGRPKKNGPQRPARPTEIPLRAALEEAGSCATLSAEESNALVRKWAEVIRKEAGEEVAAVFRMMVRLLTEREIAEELRLKVRVVKCCVDEAWSVLNRHL